MVSITAGVLLFSHYCKYPYHLGVIFVVDSSDHESIGGARDELMHLLGEEELRDAPILVLANNQVRKLKLLMYHSLYMTGDISGATLMPLLHNIE